MSDIDIVRPAFTILLGKPASGKSHLLKYLLLLDHPDYNDDPIKYAIVFTNTKFNRAWTELFPADYVHPQYDPNVLQALMDIQAENSQNRVAVVFDDCLDQKAFASQLFLNLATQYRHFNINLYISTQYLYRVPTFVRECASRVAIFRLTTERSLKAAFESFGAFFKTYDEFRRWIIANTGDYRFVYFIANSTAETREEVYITAKAPSDLPDVKFEY